MGPDAMILVFWMLSFKPVFSLFYFTFIKRLFSSSLSAIRVVSSAYLRLLIFLLQSWFQLVIHPAQCVSWCTLHLSWITGWQYTALTCSYPYLEPVCCCMFNSACCFLTCIRFLKRQVTWSGIPISFPQFIVIYTVKGFGIVNKAEIDAFLELSFSMIQWMFVIWSLVPLPFLNPAWTSGSSVCILLKPGLENFEH